MKSKKITALYMSIVIIIVIAVVNSAINAKRFDLTFPVYKEQSDIQIDNVLLTGTLIRFPLNLYYINGYLTVGDNTYELANYRSLGFNPISKVNIYELELIDNGSNGYIHGRIFLNGDIIQENLININISIDFVDETTGHPHSQVINTSSKQD